MNNQPISYDVASTWSNLMFTFSSDFPFPLQSTSMPFRPSSPCTRASVYLSSSFFLPRLIMSSVVFIQALPHEMLIKIFRDLDVVSQKRAERVCRVWRDLLRDTFSPKERLKVDLAFLANIRPHNPDESLVARVIRTFDMAMAGYPGAIAQLHLTNETSTTASGEEGQMLAYKAASQDALSNTLFRATRVIFDGITVQAFLVSLLLYNSAWCETSGTVEFRNVKITQLYPSGRTFGDVALTVGDHSTRNFSCTLLYGQNHPNTFVEFVEELYKQDPELSADQDGKHESSLLLPQHPNPDNSPIPIDVGMENVPLKRLMSEHQQIVSDPVEGIMMAGPVTEANYFEWEALILGPAGTCFEGGIYPVRLTFPHDYPLNPPTMTFTCQMFHPNIYKDGRVAISILNPPGDDPLGYETSAERWSPVQSIEKILLSVMSLLADPNVERPTNVDAAISHSENRADYELINQQLALRTLGYPD